MNTPFVFETEAEGFDPEMESVDRSYETDFGETEFEEEVRVRDHRRSANRPMGGGVRPPVRAIPPTFGRPGFRGANIRPSIRPTFNAGVRPPFRRVVRGPFRNLPGRFQQPFRPFGPGGRPVWGRGYRSPYPPAWGTGYRRPYGPGYRWPFRTPFGVRPGPFVRPPFRRPWGRPFLEGVNRHFPPTESFPPEGGDSLPQRPDRLILLIQSLLNRLNGSNLPVSGVMNGATLDAINQVAPEETPSQAEPGGAPPPPSAPEQADQGAPAPAPGPPPNGEAEYFLNDYELEDEFETFGGELESEDEAEGFLPADISQLQMALSQALGTQLEPDGQMNFRTRRALRLFQQQNGLPTTGFLDRRTRRRLIPGRGYGGSYGYGRRRPYGSYFEAEADFETSPQKKVLVWYSNPLPASENGRFLAALAKLEKLIYSSGNRRDLRYLCWLAKLKVPGTDDRVVEWPTICPAKTGALGAAMLVGPCDLTKGSPINQATIQKSFKTVDDVERKGQSVGIFTYVRSSIVVSAELTTLPLENFRNLYDNVITATHKLHTWANNPMGGSSAMPKAYIAIKDWIGRKQRDRNSLNSC